VLVEIVVVLVLLLWAGGRVQFKGFKRQYFFWIFFGLIIVESIAAFFGESVLASFFGDMERMWGIITMFHIFLFYIVARIFFGEREWRVFFNVSFITSLLVSAYGIIQRNPDFFRVYLFDAGEGSRITSTLGNPVYVAMYLLFHIGFALYFLMLSNGRKIRYFYGAVIAVDFYAFTLTDIRGAYVGLVLGAAVAAILYAFLGKRKRLKQAIVGMFVLGVIVISLGVRFRSSDMVRHTPILGRLSTISIQDETTQTRFIGWNAAMQGFLKDPLTGVGMENYGVLFNEYFPARYYLFAPTETYFDRAHNQFLNVLAESGILALLLYLGFPVLLGWYLIQGYRNKRFELGEFLLFSGLIVAYFVHLFFVFDDIQSLLFFVALLGIIEFRYYGSVVHTSVDAGAVHRKKTARSMLVAIIILLALYSAVHLNFNVVRAAGYSGKAFLSQDSNESIENYRRALAVNLIPSENAVLNFSEYLIGLSEKQGDIQAQSSFKTNVVAAFSEAEQALLREIEKKPNDVIFYVKLGQLNNTWFLLDNEVSHLSKAIAYVERGMPLSLERIQLYLILGESYVLAGESEKAVEVLEQAVRLEPKFSATYYYLGRALLTNGQLEEAYDAIVNKAFIERNYHPENNTIAFVLAEEMATAGEYKKMVMVYQYLIVFEPRSARVYSALAIAYVLADQPEDAIRAAQKAAELDPSFAAESRVFIQAIQDGRIDELKQSAF